MSLINNLPAVKPQKTSLPAGDLTGTTAPEVPAQLTASPFHIDHEAEARAKVIEQLREDAHEMDASVARLRILGDHTLADEEGDYARALRVAAQHLAAADAVP